MCAPPPAVGASPNSPRAATAPADEKDLDEELKKECFKLLVLAGIIVAIVLLSQEIGSALLSTRGWLVKHIPMWLFVVLNIVINGGRRLFPPAYYCVPVGLISLLYLVAKYGWLAGGFIYEALKLADFFWEPLIERWYSGYAAQLLDPEQDSRKIRRWLPGGVAELLVILDREWRQRIAPAGGRPPWVRAGTVALLGSAWATDEELTLYFLATRCELSWLFFCGCWTVTLVAKLPYDLVRAYTLKSFVHAAARQSWGVLFRAFGEAPLGLLIAWVLVDGVSTLVVHGVHVGLIWKSELGREPEPDLGIELPRDARREQILAQQRRDLESSRVVVESDVES
mmetsp:Transcript_838/g.2469  ORF Transcript_838/g.2469 Transcript_838/m.2469 type:complete len:340 (+) Transcript_838:211-1230(+)